MKRKIPLVITLFSVIFFGATFLTPFSASAVNLPPPSESTCNKTPDPAGCKKDYEKCGKGNSQSVIKCRNKVLGNYLAKTLPKLPPVHKPSPAPAKTTCNKDAGCDLIDTYVNPLVNLLSVAFGLIAVISIIMGGIQYSASEGDPQKSAQAKSRITNTLVAIFAYLFLYIFLQFLIPGGLFH